MNSRKCVLMSAALALAGGVSRGQETDMTSYLQVTNVTMAQDAATQNVANATDYSADTVLDTRLCAEAAAEPHALDSRLLAEDWGAPVPLDTARDLGTVYRFL